MQELSIAEGGMRRRDFADVVWQIAECRGCDEVVIRYDCGHVIAADVWAPSLPRTRDYGSQEAERRRFMQHSLYVLTKDPGAPKVQIAVPEGRCRHCGRGTRQVLICGPLQMDLSEDRQRSGAPGPRPAAMARRLELPLSSHAFLAAMGQVCRMPENITPPPLVRGGLTRGAVIRPFDGPPLPREGMRQWTRREVEDELRSQLARCEGGAACALLGMVLSCIALITLQLGLRGVSTADPQAGNSSAEADINATQALSTFALAAQALKESPEAPSTGGSSLFWSLLVRPIWLLIVTLLAPVLWVLDLAVAVPRFVLLDVCLGLLRKLILQPCSWVLSFTVEAVSGTSTFLFRCFLSRPTAVLSQIPVTNPMAVSMALSLLVAALSAPQPPSLSLPSLWGELPNLEIAKGLRKAASRSKSLAPLVQRLRMLSLWASARKDRRQKGGGVRGVPAGRGQKERGHADRSDKKSDVPGKPDKPQAGQKEGKAPSGSSHQQQSAPACFVCLDRPSRYILEPCGHRVVCEECAMQIVENAVRSRSTSEAAGGGHHSAERGGGACPLCGLVITRAMRLFS